MRWKLQERIESQREALLVERRDLPGLVAKLSAEGRNLVETLTRTKGTAHRILEERIEDLGAQLTVHENRLRHVERALAVLDHTEVEVGWVAEMLVKFDRIWDVLSIENRARLVRAIVERVEVDEPSGRVTAVLVDFDIEEEGGGTPPAEEHTAAMETTA